MKLWTGAAGTIATLAIFAASVPSAHGAGYPRPKGATPMRIPLVPIFERCNSPAGGGRTADSTHGPPLANPSCADLELVSGQLTIGTPDTNGKQAYSTGNLNSVVISGDSATPADEADVRGHFVRGS
jgi:hypothetical protein